MTRGADCAGAGAQPRSPHSPGSGNHEFNSRLPLSIAPSVPASLTPSRSKGIPSRRHTRQHVCSNTTAGCLPEATWSAPAGLAGTPSRRHAVLVCSSFRDDLASPNDASPPWNTLSYRCAGSRDQLASRKAVAAGRTGCEHKEVSRLHRSDGGSGKGKVLASRNPTPWSRRDPLTPA